jgi:hypothetical protein
MMTTLDTLKAGDDVVVRLANKTTIKPITRVTGSSIHVNGVRYSNVSGKEIGGSLGRTIRPATLADTLQYQRTNLIKSIQKTDFNTLTVDTLQAILDLIKQDVTTQPV